MARPILRLATRLTRRTRATAWAIAFACMVLVGALSLADGLVNGVGSVADRIGSGPSVYVHGRELLASEIEADRLAAIPVDFVALRVREGELEINNLTVPIMVVALVDYRSGVVTNPYPTGARDVSLDTGLQDRIERRSGAAVEPTGTLTLFGLRLTNLPIVPPPPTRLPLFADDWAYVRADLLAGMDPVRGGSVQAIIASAPLDPAVTQSLGLTRLETIGAIGFVRASVTEVQSALRTLGLLIAVVIGLLVYAAMSLEVHARSREIATLRSLGAAPRAVAIVYEAQAIVLALAGAILGSALGIVISHAIVSFASLAGLPNLVILTPPLSAVGLALVLAMAASVVGGLVPSRRAAVRVLSKEAVPT